MLISDKAKTTILDIIERHFNALLVRIAGKDAVSSETLKNLIKLGLLSEKDVDEGIMDYAYFIGRLRPEHKPPETTLEDLARQKAKLPISDVERFAIQHINESAGNYITKLKDATKVQLANIVGNENIDYRNKVLNETVRPTLKEGIARRKSVSSIASQLRDSTKDMYRNWERVVVSEATSALNLGAHDAIVKRNGDKPSNEIYVYKITKSDEKLCKHCDKFYNNSNGTPKVYRLSDLQANGSNFGRKAADMKPVIQSTHPNCRCSLLELSPGWDFDEDNGELKYVGVGNEKWRKNLK